MKITFDDVMIATSSAFRVEMFDLLGPARGARISLARQSAMWLTASLTTLPYAGIARAMGRDRTSVRHGVRTIEFRLARHRMGCGFFEDHALAARLDLITASLRAREDG